MLELGVVKKSSSPWCSPVLLVKKANGEFRLCFDGRKLNSLTKRDSYYLPHISYILDCIKDAKFMSSIDLRHAFCKYVLTLTVVKKLLS